MFQESAITMTDHKKFFKACQKGLLGEVERFFTPPSVSVNAIDHRGWTALHMTAAVGRKDVAELLIEKGADVNAKDYKGYTPLSLAALDSDKHFAELLIEKGADVNARNNKGLMTPLSIASNKGHNHAPERI